MEKARQRKERQQQQLTFSEEMSSLHRHLRISFSFPLLLPVLFSFHSLQFQRLPASSPCLKALRSLSAVLHSSLPFPSLERPIAFVSLPNLPIPSRRLRASTFLVYISA